MLAARLAMELSSNFPRHHLAACNELIGSLLHLRLLEQANEVVQITDNWLKSEGNKKSINVLEILRYHLLACQVFLHSSQVILLRNFFSY